MTVQELIDLLQAIEDKTLPVGYYDTEYFADFTFNYGIDIGQYCTGKRDENNNFIYAPLVVIG